MDSAKKILIVSHYCLPHIGGIEQVVANQAVFLAENNFEVSVICCAAEDEIPGQGKWQQVSVFRLSPNNFVVRRFNIPFPLLGVRAIAKIWTSVKNSEMVHIHDVFYQTSWYAGLFAVCLRKPLYLTQHVALVDHSSKMVTLVQKIVYSTIGTLLFRKARAIIVYNNYVKNFLEGCGVTPSKVFFIGNGIDTNFFSPVQDISQKQILRKELGLPLDKILVLFAGRFVDKKGFAIAYASRSEKYQMVFVGSGDFPEDWKKTPGIIFLGPKKPEELALIYKACDLFVLPTIGEVMTLTIQEAMASGLPVVTTKNAAYSVYDLDPQAFFLVDRNFADIRDSLEKIATNSGQYNIAAQYSRTYAVQHFNWRINAKMLLEIYSKY